MLIEVKRNPPSVIIDGFGIATAPPVADLLEVIGMPTRVDTGPRPAPPGFRNNHQHVFDSLGIHVNEHHQTRRAQSIGVALSVDEARYGFTPKSPFAGQLQFDGVAMPLRATEREFLEVSPWPFQTSLSGRWFCEFDGFSVDLDAVGPKLPSGRRSKLRVIVEVSISWTHDPHGDPAGGG